MLLYLFFIIFVLLMDSVAYNPYDSMICMDCGDQCGVVEKRGTSCKSARKNMEAWRNRRKNVSISTSHLMCIPDNLELVEVDPAYCCIWAPEFGCRLVRSVMDDHINCRRCINPKRKRRGYTLCPCRGCHREVAMELVAIVVGLNIIRQMS